MLRLLVLTLAFLPWTFSAYAAELREFADCRLVPTEWADGDSFRVRFPDGSEHTLRLYGADCFETRANNSTDARRLRAQRRYFGISEYGDGPRDSIELAKRLGHQATARRREILSTPFTVWTAFADGGGSGNHKRIYAFVETAQGRDLATLLVRHGLARAYGLYRSSPGGLHRDEYHERLKDTELVAARKGLGAWGHTNWELLPEERRAQRREEAEDAIAMGRSPPPDPLNINEAPPEELARIPGIGDVLAGRIVKNRPYADAEDLLRVNGIGPVTLKEIRRFVSVPLSP